MENSSDSKIDSVQYVYHRKRPEFIGTSIIPLNQMPTIPNFDSSPFQKLYETALAKYKGRESLLQLTMLHGHNLLTTVNGMMLSF